MLIAQVGASINLRQLLIYIVVAAAVWAIFRACATHFEMSPFVIRVADIVAGAFVVLLAITILFSFL